MEHRHSRPRAHLLSCRQQNLCLRYSRRSTHSYAYAECNSNANANTYALTQREPYPYAESNTEVAPDSTVAPDSSAATVKRNERSTGRNLSAA